MKREELRTLPLDHAWTPEALCEHFAAIMGGVAYLGKRAGAAVVAGLCHPRSKDDLEIHVLAEAESWDLGELLRACRGLGKRYQTPGTLPPAPFRWVGDGKHAGARSIIDRLNQEAGHKYNQVSINSTAILDDPTPYPTMFALLSDLTEPKRLYLHGAGAGHAMNEVPRDQVADCRFGDLPSIEALAFVADALRAWLDYWPYDRIDRNASPYRNWPRFNRGGRR
jgi:hypothetical protein